MGITLPSINQWYFVTAVYQSGVGSTLYVNGQSTFQASTTGGLSLNSQVTIGGNGSDNNNTLNGTMDEVQIYKRALSAAEIYNLYVNQYAPVKLTKFPNIG